MKYFKCQRVIVPSDVYSEQADDAKIAKHRMQRSCAVLFGNLVPIRAAVVSVGLLPNVQKVDELL